MKRIAIAGALALTAAALLSVPRVEFVLGGALVNLGYRFQDHLDAYDLSHHEDITAEDVWAEFQSQNRLAASVRRTFPRTARHPLVALLVCMDARIDTNELSGDTRRAAYVLRTAGSVMAEEEAEMLELAVNNGVKLVVLTRHSDCAAERATKDPEARARYPTLVSMVEQREARVKAFLARPAIAAKLAAGELLVKEARIDTESEALLPAP